ncbi:hypothetical protein [Sporosarcina sp. 179-K 8C2 HS]|uniref:hypothetical protein n=1 Tax=Sporosarcina sp. 179-K 8C2 HS TaxID=3142387 RepID=UPI0039A0ABC9
MGSEAENGPVSVKNHLGVISIRHSSIKNALVFMVILIFLTSCNKEIVRDDIGVTDMGIYKNDAGTSYFWITIDPNQPITINNSELDPSYGIKAQAIEYNLDYTEESFERSERIEFPIDLKENERVRILFVSDKTSIDVTTVEIVYLEVNGKTFEYETGFNEENNTSAQESKLEDTRKKSMEPKADRTVLEEVESQANDFLKKDKEISAFTIDSIEYSHENQDLDKVYILYYSMKPSNPESFILTGGGVMGDDGWVKERVYYIIAKDSGELLFSTSP